MTLNYCLILKASKPTYVRFENVIFAYTCALSLYNSASHRGMWDCILVGYIDFCTALQMNYVPGIFGLTFIQIWNFWHRFAVVVIGPISCTVQGGLNFHIVLWNDSSTNLQPEYANRDRAQFIKPFIYFLFLVSLNSIRISFFLLSCILCCTLRRFFWRKSFQLHSRSTFCADWE